MGREQQSQGRIRLQKSQRTTRVSLAHLLMNHGENAPEVLRRMADELEWLADDLESEESRSELGAARPTWGYIWGYAARVTLMGLRGIRNLTGLCGSPPHHHIPFLPPMSPHQRRFELGRRSRAGPTRSAVSCGGGTVALLLWHRASRPSNIRSPEAGSSAGQGVPICCKPVRLAGEGTPAPTCWP